MVVGFVSLHSSSFSSCSRDVEDDDDEDDDDAFNHTVLLLYSAEVNNLCFEALSNGSRVKGLVW